MDYAKKVDRWHCILIHVWVIEDKGVFFMASTASGVSFGASALPRSRAEGLQQRGLARLGKAAEGAVLEDF